MTFDGPLFLVGMPRSGTKLLRDLLNNHPRIGIPDVETEFLPWLEHALEGFGDLSQPRAFEAFASEMSRLTYFQQRRSRATLPTAAEWHDACQSLDAAGIFEALIRLEVGAARGSGRIWGDKSPSYIDDLQLLLRLYPSARIIHLIRDVRDYCLSMREAWGKDILRAAQRWADDVDAASAAGRHMGNQYLEVKYEELLRSPERELRNICDFVGLEMRPEMLELTRPTENIGDAKGATRIVAANTDKFRARLRTRELKRIEAIAGATMQRLGYERALETQASRRLSALEMALAQVRDGWNLMRYRRDGGLLRSVAFHIRYFLTTRG